MKKVFAIFFFALLGGCGWFDDEYIKWSDWDVDLVTIVDDSLAVLKSSRVKSICHEEGVVMVGTWDECNDIEWRTGLFLVNYREKKEPLWGDIINDNFIFISGYYKDSRVLFHNGDNSEFGFWNIMGNPTELKEWDIDKCEYNLKNATYLSATVLDMDTIIVYDPVSENLKKCVLFGINLNEREVANVVAENNYSWFKECDYASSQTNNRICLIKNFDNFMNVWFDSVKIDSVTVPLVSAKNWLSVWHNGIYLETKQYGKDIYFKLDVKNKKIDGNYEPVQIETNNASIFIKKEGGSIIEYSAKYLLGVVK